MAFVETRVQYSEWIDRQKETGGLFDRKTATAFRDSVLAKGDTEDPMALYKRFRGKERSIEPLLERRGLK